MSITDESSRRHIVEDLTASLSAGYPVEPWTGDDFKLESKLNERPTSLFPVHSEKTVDFVIVGGGMAGLTSSYYLRDTDFLLLEQYPSLGGQSRGNVHRGLAYAYGAQSFNDLEDPIGSLINDLSLSPIKLSPTRNAWLFENDWLAGVEGNNKLYSEFKKLVTDFKPIWKVIHKAVSVIPLEDPQLAKLDNDCFESFLTGFSPAFITLLDGFLKSSNCAGSDRLSALAAISSLEDLDTPSYTFEGGNQAITNALAARLPQEHRQKGFVWSVEITDGRADVVYTGDDRELHRVTCKHVIITTPPLVALKLLNGVREPVKQSMSNIEYGSYLVANLKLRERVFKGAYDNWMPSSYTFSDITIAETPYLQNGTYDEAMGSILTVYQPYEPGSNGRSVLSAGDKQHFAHSIISQITSLVPDIEKQVESVELTRWSDAIAVPEPGFFTKISNFNSTEDSGFTYAHCSTQGLACAESAIIAARLAADRALNSTRFR